MYNERRPSIMATVSIRTGLRTSKMKSKSPPSGYFLVRTYVFRFTEKLRLKVLIFLILPMPIFIPKLLPGLKQIVQCLEHRVRDSGLIAIHSGRRSWVAKDKEFFVFPIEIFAQLSARNIEHGCSRFLSHNRKFVQQEKYMKRCPSVVNTLLLFRMIFFAACDTLFAHLCWWGFSLVPKSVFLPYFFLLSCVP